MGLKAKTKYKTERISVYFDSKSYERRVMGNTNKARRS